MLAELLLQLQEHQSSSESANLGLSAALELSWNSLDEATQQIVMALSLFASTPIPQAMLEKVLDIFQNEATNQEDITETNGVEIRAKWHSRVQIFKGFSHRFTLISVPFITEACSRLVQKHWLELADESTYCLHAPLRDYLRIKLDQFPNADRLKRAFCEAMVSFAKQLSDPPPVEECAAFAPAIPHIVEAVTTWETWLTNENLVFPYFCLGRFYAAQGALDQATQWYEQCLLKARDCLSNDDLAIAASLTHLANLYYRQSLYKEAEPLYQEALELLQQALGHEHPAIAVSITNLVNLHEASHELKQAAYPLEQFHQALNISREHEGAIFHEGGDTEHSSSSPVMTTQSIPHLVLQTDLGSRYLSLIGSNCWTFGRGDDNNFVLPDRWISRNHAMLQRVETGEFYLIDMGSRNGSFVNGRRVSVPVTLQNGDRLTFGQTKLEFYASEPDLLDPSTGNIDSQEFTATATLNVRRLISVLVVDIRNFTGMTRQLNDENLLSEVIGTWFRCAGDIIREYGSWVDKYIGDAVMAVWIHGAQGVTPEEMIRIAHALSALQKMTSQLHERYPKLPFPLKVGAGLNTGYAMVGNTGTGDRPEYTALGDTVNAAFRLESSTKQIGADIALGETTYQYLKEAGLNPSLFEQHSVVLKGFDSLTTTYAGCFASLDEFLDSNSVNSSENSILDRR